MKLKSILHNVEKSEGGISEIQVNRIIRTSINDLAKQINIKNKSQDDRMDDIVKRLIKIEDPSNSQRQKFQRMKSLKKMTPSICQEQEPTGNSMIAKGSM